MNNMDKKNKADRLIWRYIKKNESQTKAEKILTKKL